MEKYATYRIFKNEDTGEIKRVPHEQEDLMSKVSSKSEWKEIYEDPENE